MTYKAQLYPWCIIGSFPNMRTQIVGRFRSRSDTEGHLLFLKRLIPNIPYPEVPPVKKLKLPHRATLSYFLVALHGYNR